VVVEAVVTIEDISQRGPVKLLTQIHWLTEFEIKHRPPFKQILEEHILTPCVVVVGVVRVVVVNVVADEISQNVPKLKEESEII
jgi:hypothetical protein